MYRNNDLETKHGTTISAKTSRSSETEVANWFQTRRSVPQECLEQSLGEEHGVYARKNGRMALFPYLLRASKVQ